MIPGLLLSVLDAVEAREMRLLSWGVVDGALRTDELQAIVDPLLDQWLDEGGEGFFSSESVIDALRARALLHRTPEDRWRSRLAEFTRLLQRLRQIFPNQGDPRRSDWRGSPTLVADFRIVRRPRRYPRRDQSLVDLCAHQANAGLAVEGVNALQALAPHAQQQALPMAGFQVRATQRILDGLRRGRESATAVCAGTGSGKTLAFYLPALTYLSGLITTAAQQSWVKALALYPRNELLKDQLAEVYAQARRLDELQRGRGARKLTVAAYFGPAPRSAEDRSLEWAGWQRVGDAYLCDYIRCPRGCDQPMGWRDTDRKAGRERLHCTQCDAAVREDEIRLTRERIERDPPDVLFTTTETLNRRMSDSRARHLFGIGVRPGRTPSCVLLDEIHTYSGTHGAQVANLLRRWRKSVGAPMTWVGLSATLRAAPAFFRDLTGLPESAVAEVSPFPGELEEEGAEYMLAVRGDPASRTSLLSTTIQTAMLLARIQDTRLEARSEGIYANRTFVFTDDIDVTNRLYFDLLDAEGRDSFRNVDASKPQGGLAVLRTPEPGNLSRYRHGQDWQLANDIGHQLNERLLIGRTSSQDAGVDRHADVIVATASLEVGFNDPTVGAVLQHKAPRDVAQYLQRKGRAGRQRSVRPWTVLVLSDYGRDRLAYQNYHSLFSPELPPRHLPVRNRNVQRMQAVYATLDYLRERVGAPGSVWRALVEPATYAGDRLLQAELAQAVQQLLRDPVQADRLGQHLCTALQLDEDDLVPLVWGYPRPLLLAALPTALRRLQLNWAGAAGPETDAIVRDNPLPEFVPASLFSDLNLPEVTLDAPPQTRNGPREQYAMPLLQAMRQFAPGRVSRRFGIVHRRVRHWLPIPLDVGTPCTLDLGPLGQFAELGHFDLLDAEGRAKAMRVLLPRRLQLETPPSQVNDTSNAWLQWHTQIVPPPAGLRLPRASDEGCAGALASIDVYAHQNLQPLQVRRFATGSDASVQLRGASASQTVRASFVRDGAPAAVGFSLLVDGICFRLTLPSALWSDAGGHTSAKWRALRVLRYRDAIACGSALGALDNDFMRVRLAEIFFTAICTHSQHAGTGLAQSAATLAGDDSLTALVAVLDATLQRPEMDGGTPSQRQERLRADLLAALSMPSVRQELQATADVLWQPIDESWEPWLRRVYRDTIAGVLLQAVLAMCPGVDESQVVVDTDPGPRPTTPDIIHDDEVWLTESAVGGAGIVEQFVTRYGSDPTRFAALCDRALGSNEWEQVDLQLERLVQALAGDSVPALADAVARFRSADRADEMSKALADLRQELARGGWTPHASFLSALLNRLLRPGSLPQADHFVAWALRQWEALQERLGVEVDLATLIPMLSEAPEAQQMLDVLEPDATADQDVWRTSVLSGLLWPRGAALRCSDLEHWNPFRPTPALERLLVVEQMQRARPRIDLARDDWRDVVAAALTERRSLTVFATPDRCQEAAKFCTFLAAHSVESGYLLLHARVRDVRIDVLGIEIDAEIAEGIAA